MKKRFIRVWLDDIRDTPNNDYWLRVSVPPNFKRLIETFPEQIAQISFDHDLGFKETGYDLLRWYCEESGHYDDEVIITFHSANPIGHENMVKYYNNFRKHREA